MRALTVIPGVSNSAVNANRQYYQQAAESLARADLGWLSRVVNRTVPLDDWRDALTRQKHDVKPVIQLSAL